MPKKQKANAQLREIKETFLKHAEDLWKKHEKEFMGILDETEGDKINLSFTASLDFSESTAKLQTSLRFSVVHKDSREADFDDPNQTLLPGTTAKDLVGKSRKREAVGGKEAASGERAED